MIPLLNEGPSVETGLLVYSYGVLIATTHGNATPYRWGCVSVGALCASSPIVFFKEGNRATISFQKISLFLKCTFKIYWKKYLHLCFWMLNMTPALKQRHHIVGAHSGE